MKTIKVSGIRKVVSELCLEANINLCSDVITALKKAFMVEKNNRAKRIIKLILENAYFARKEKLPICQDTGMAVVYCYIGQQVKLKGADLTRAINQGVKAGYKTLRKSVVKDPLISRTNTGDNTPAIIHFGIIKGDKIKITLSVKGFGCENKSRVKMFLPTQKISEIEDFIVKTVLDAGPDACPPYVLGVGIGGTQDKATLLAKEAALRPLNKPHPDKRIAHLEKRILNKINHSGIGPMGLGGRITALAVNILTYPTHIAGLPVAVNISCHATRRASRIL
jgi:fumarate hydratase subunit alpha